MTPLGGRSYKSEARVWLEQASKCSWLAVVMSEQTVPRETSSASLRQSRAAEVVGGEEEGSSSSKSHQQQLSSSRGGRLVVEQQQQGSSSSSSSSSGQQSSSTEFGDAAQYQELNPIGEGNMYWSKYKYILSRLKTQLTSFGPKKRLNQSVFWSVPLAWNQPLGKTSPKKISSSFRHWPRKGRGSR